MYKDTEADRDTAYRTHLRTDLKVRIEGVVAAKNDNAF